MSRAGSFSGWYDWIRKVGTETDTQARLITLGAWGGYACTVARVFGVTTDDPYITLRYAANWLAGHGPVFNPGERVEGYTSPLHLVLCVVLTVLGGPVDILMKAKLCSILWGGLTLALTAAVAKRFGLSARCIAISQLLLAVNVNYSVACVNALETTLYGTLVAVSLLALTSRRADSWPVVWFSAFMALATFARPEGAMLWLCCLCLRIPGAVRARQLRTVVSGMVIPYALPIIAFELWRYGYYGELLPNTYFAKSVALPYGLKSGVLYLMRTVQDSQPSIRAIRNGVVPPGTALSLIAAPLYWMLVLFGGRALLRLRSSHAVFLATAVLATAMFVLRSGGDWMPGWRHMVGVLPLLGVAQVHGIRTMRAMPSLRRFAFPCLWVYVCSLGIGQWLAPHKPFVSLSETGRSLLARGRNGWGPTWVATGDWIHAYLPAGSLVAYTEMGYAPFVNMNMRFIDLAGLVDREVARLATATRSERGVDAERWWHPRHPLYGLLQRRSPDYIVSLAHGPEPDSVLGMYARTAQLTGGVRVYALSQHRGVADPVSKNR